MLSFPSAGTPGMFSLQRLIGNCILPNGKDYTFWGRGVSQGHSDAIRRIKGVKDGKQYTVPVPAALEKVRAGENPELTTREKHTRECYVVAEEGADLARIENEIKTMPNYFADYDTTVHFISQEELDRDHSGIPHGGFVIRTGTTGADTKQMIEYSLKLGSKPRIYFQRNCCLCKERLTRWHRRASQGQRLYLMLHPPIFLPCLRKEQRKKSALILKLKNRFWTETTPIGSPMGGLFYFPFCMTSIIVLSMGAIPSSEIRPRFFSVCSAEEPITPKLCGMAIPSMASIAERYAA